MRRSSKHQEKDKKSVKILIAIACLSLFPTIYLVGKCIKDFI